MAKGRVPYGKLHARRHSSPPPRRPSDRRARRRYAGYASHRPPSPPLDVHRSRRCRARREAGAQNHQPAGSPRRHLHARLGGHRPMPGRRLQSQRGPVPFDPGSAAVRARWIRRVRSLFARLDRRTRRRRGDRLAHPARLHHRLQADLAGRHHDRTPALRPSDSRLLRRGGGDRARRGAIRPDIAPSRAGVDQSFRDGRRPARHAARDRRRAPHDQVAAQMLTHDLRAVARQVMIDDGFDPEFGPGVESELRNVGRRADNGPALVDMRDQLWSSIDNDDTRDLDQIEYAEEADGGDFRLYIGIADVDAEVPKGSAIDAHAAAQTTSVYTGAVIFPMIPTELSAGATSLFSGADRKCVMVEMLIGADGGLKSARIYRVLVKNRAQLTYSGVGGWLDTRAGVPGAIAKIPGLEAQVRLQAKIAAALRKTRLEKGALDIDTIEARAVSTNGQVTAIERTQKNSATDVIEDFMIAANESVASFLEQHRVSGIRRIVRSPERWERIVDLAKQFGKHLPVTPDPVALQTFMLERKAADPDHFPDLSLAVVKLLGPGEYILDQAGVEEPGHFGLAVQDYTHSTAPNRRYADLVTQRIVKAVVAGNPPPYTDDELAAIARNCTVREDAARKVERSVRKIAAAILFSNRIGERFKAIVTGNKSSGTYVRVVNPPVEGRLLRGEKDVDVGDEIEVELLSTNPTKGFIDFGRVGSTPTPNPPGKR